jgi:hypothetical protein
MKKQNENESMNDIEMDSIRYEITQAGIEILRGFKS